MSDPMSDDTEQITEVYRERAALLAHIAASDPFASIAYNSTQYPDTPVLYLRRGRMSWHLNPEHLAFFEHVPQVPADDPRVQYDGHTTTEKYDRLTGETEVIARDQVQPGECWITGADGKPHKVQIVADEASFFLGRTRTGKYDTDEEGSK